MRETYPRFFSASRLLTGRPGVWRIVLLLSNMLLLLSPTAAQDNVRFDVQAQRNGALIEVRALALVNAPLSIVWSTLTDYERLPEFIPGLASSRVIARDGSRVTVAQTGQARFLFLTVPIVVTLESTERPPHVVEVRRIAGTLRYLRGRYEAIPVSGQQVQLRWTGSISPEAELPPLINTALTRLSIEEQFAGMVREIERRAGNRPPAVVPDRRLAR